MTNTSMKVSPLSRLREELGEENLRVHTPDPETIIQRGIKVTLKVNRWRASEKMELRDLGLDEMDPEAHEIFTQYFRLGSRRICTKAIVDLMAAKEVAMRSTLYANSVSTAIGRIVKKEKYLDLRRLIMGEDKKDESGKIVERVRGLVDDFYDVRDVIVNNLNDIREQVRKDYETQALQAFRVKHGREVNLDAAEDSAWVENYVERILKKIPSAEDIKAMFNVDWVPEYVQFPQAMADHRNRELLEKRDEILKNMEAIKVSAKLSDDDKDMALAVLAGRLKKAEDELNEDNSLHEEVLNKRLEMVNEEFGGTIKAVAAEMRKAFAEAIVEVEHKIKSRGVVSKRVITQLRDKVAKIRTLNIADDEEINKLADAIVHAADSTHERMKGTEDESSPTVKTLRTMMERVTSILRVDLLALGENPLLDTEKDIEPMQARSIEKQMKAIQQNRKALGLAPVRPSTENTSVERMVEAVKGRTAGKPMKSISSPMPHLLKAVKSRQI